MRDSCLAKDGTFTSPTRVLTPLLRLLIQNCRCTSSPSQGMTTVSKTNWNGRCQPSRMRSHTGCVLRSRAQAMATYMPCADGVGQIFDLGPVGLLPASWQGCDDELDEVARECGLQPEIDAPWLEALTARLEPDVINCFGFVPSGILMLAMGQQRAESPPPWLLTLADSDVDAIQDNGHLAAALDETLPAVTGRLVEQAQELTFARAHGFAGNLVEIAPTWCICQLEEAHARRKVNAAIAAPNHRRCWDAWRLWPCICRIAGP